MAIAKRYDFVLLFDVEYGNPNGDPDAGNLPRIDPETMHGLVTDVSLKRKIRDYVAARWGMDPEAGTDIYVKHRGILNAEHRKAYSKLGITPVDEAGDDENGDAGTAKGAKAARGKQSRSDVAKVRAEMCRRYFDVRTFGAVMTTGVNAGQVRGPVQITFGRSIDPIVPMEIALTRVAVTKEEEAVPEEAPGTSRQKETEMGRKSLVPYGLYRAHGFVSPFFAEDTGFNDSDLNRLWDALVGMFELERTATKGQMATRRLIIFEHPNQLGAFPAHSLFDRVVVTRSNGSSGPARSFSDYKVEVRADGLVDKGVTIHERP